jgi:hydroxypyruvate isomerase
MPRFAANLTMMYGEYPFLDRFAAARGDGFDAVEFMFPYAESPEEIARRLEANNLRLVLFNAPPGNWETGDRGLASLPGREAEFRHSIEAQALPYAQALRCPRIHVMAGVSAASPKWSSKWSDPNNERSLETYRANLAWAAEQAAHTGIEILIEPINSRDMPGYFLQYQEQAHQVAIEVGAPNLKVQMDLYHCQIMEGDLASRIRRYLPTGRVGHMQIAGVPERHEPDEGEVNYPFLFELIDALDYAGTIGCEYRPKGGTSAGLEWLRRWRENEAP